MDKKNIINLIRAHVENDEESFKEAAYNVADEFDAKKAIIYSEIMRPKYI